MVKSCSAVNCTQRYEHGITFHKFPKDDVMRKKWLVAMKREKWKPSKEDVLCMSHFKDSDYDISPWSLKKTLKREAIPSRFEFPEHLRKQPKSRPSPKKRTSCEADLDIVTIAEATLNETMNDAPAPSIREKELSEPERKKRRHYIGDFAGDLEQLSSEELVHFVELAKDLLQKKNQQIKLLKQRSRRQDKKISSLKSLVEHLTNENLTSPEAATSIMASVPHSLHDSFLKKLSGKRTRAKQYSPILRSFALTLDFYSPKAYDYVREMFKNALPNRRTLQTWYQSVDCEPGFSKEALETLKRKKEGTSRSILCSLMIDEMSIKKHLQWDRTKYVGYTDHGSENENSGVYAKEVLVFMLNCANGRWKLPVGYFFITSMDGVEKANLVNACLQFLHLSGVQILSLTFDGASSNLRMCENLGASFTEPKNLKTWFQHPVTEEKIYIFFDPPHALKLIRNALGVYKVIMNADGEKIKWSHFENVVNVHTLEKLHPGCKVTKRHLGWRRERMRVKLAAQTFSDSSARAMQYLREKPPTELPPNFDIDDSRATEEFFRTFNNIFDVMNSRSRYGKHYKKGLQPENEEFIFSELIRVRNYILGLKNAKGRLMVHTARKTGFIGFLICIESLILMYVEHVLEKKTLDYILMYKFCQDHLEVFFCAIRSRGGHNNNPSAIQFKSAYKRLLLHTAVKGTNGNCQELEETPLTILFRSYNSKKNNRNNGHSIIPESILNLQFSRKDDLYPETERSDLEELVAQRGLIFQDHAYASVPLTRQLSLYVDDVVGYLAGFVVKTLRKNVICSICYTALQSTDELSYLQTIKNYNPHSSGGLTKAAPDVIHLCRLAETIFREFESNLYKINNVMEFLILKTLNGLHKPLFTSIGDHMVETASVLEENHVYNLQKIILYKYFTIRLHHFAFLINENNIKFRVRNVNNKTTLFQNQ